MLSIQKQGQKISKYFRPVTLGEALSLLDEHQDHARLIAGGTDLMIELDRSQRPGIDALIDLSNIKELSQITYQNGRIELGCMVTHNQIVGSPEMVQDALPLAQACWEIGSPQLRNRATVVGNLVTASPANDTITPLLALDATLTAVSVDGEREIPLEAFYLGIRQTALKPNEIVSKISFAPMTADQRGIFVKLGLRKAQAISVVHLAIILTFDGEIVRDARITLGSVAPTVIRVEPAEAALNGRALSDTVIETAAERTAVFPRPIDDLRGTADYRRSMIEVMVKRALKTISEGRERENWPEEPILLNAPVGYPSDQSIKLSDEEELSCLVNGHPVSAPGGASRSLLHWLREEVRLPDGQLAVGSKEGCNEGECGACTVFLNGEAVMSCITPAGAAAGGSVRTIEGLSPGESLHPLQQAFIETGAVQCGYCIPGFLMSGAKLLEEVPQPTDEQILQGLSGNLCRCTGYYKIIEAVHKAAGERAE
ncbi:MAG: FAD binding domain-containing protein [Ardenticatenaceae bacterium]|nr:FAD binding domain-containing protein [Ardenticatenaceae bacterium]